MKLVTFDARGFPEPGAVVDDQVVSLRRAGFDNLVSLIAGGAESLDAVARLLGAAAGGDIHELPNVRILAPIPRPPKIICVGLNYRDHAAEANLEIPDVPTIFSKFPTAVIGPGEPIILPQGSRKPDYEAEFAFVIGKRGRHIREERWREHVFGYMCLNDVSARDFQMATTQWIMGKTFDTFAPMGPWLVTADEIEDPHALDIRLTLNGELMQSSNTSHLIFKIPDLIAHLSEVFTLEPGDVISSGTPAGVGFARQPPRFLQPGDEVVVSVQGIGELRNPVVAERLLQ